MIPAFPDAALDDRIAIVGTAGAGKTYAAKGLVERVARTGARLCIVDPLGVWWGLRAGRDGQPAGGLSLLILGGAHADVPLAEADGDAIGRLVGASAIQCVIDLSTLPSKAARQRFMRGFLESVHEANTQPLHLVLDEADLWSPQRPMPDQVMLQNRVGEIVRRGRVRGFIPWLLTQRPAVIDKDVLSQADVLIAMKLTSSQDRTAIGGWIEGQADRAEEKRVLADLPRLQVGEGYVWAPARGVLARVTFPAIATYDSSRTPRRGDRTAGAALAPVDAAAAIALLAKARPAAAPSNKPAPTSDALQRARADGYIAGLAEAEAFWTAQLQLIRTSFETFAAEFDQQLCTAFGSPLPPPSETTVEAAPAPRRRVPSPTTSAAGHANSALHPAARAMLAVLASSPTPLTWRQVATLAGLSPRGGHWNAGRKQLRDLLLVNEADDQLVTTGAGDRAAGSPPRASHLPEAVLALWCAKLSSPAPEMLRTLAASSAPIPRDRLAAHLGKKPHGGHWHAGMKALRDNGLVVETPEGLQVVEGLR